VRKLAATMRMSSLAFLFFMMPVSNSNFTASDKWATDNLVNTLFELLVGLGASVRSGVNEYASACFFSRK
jgi:hypothetical protein